VLHAAEGSLWFDSVQEQKKTEARKMLQNAAESHTSGAPKKIARDHFIRENVALFRQDARKSGSFLKNGAFFTVSKLRSENALLGGFGLCKTRCLKKIPSPTC
jgi:hypothetical protein